MEPKEGAELIGERIHYVSHGTPILADGTQTYPSLCRAGTITEVGTPDTEPCPHEEQVRYGGGCAVVGLAALNPTGLFFRPLSEGGAHHDAAGAPGTWHWAGDIDRCGGGT